MMAADKMDSLAVYALFEEVKQKIVELSKTVAQPAQLESTVNSAETTALLEELRGVVALKQFTPEQIEELQQNMAGFTGHALDKSFAKWDKDFSTITNLVNQIEESINALSAPQNTVIRKEHAFSIDFKNSKAAITMIAMGLVILLSLGGNIWQCNRSSQLKDNDMKSP